MPFKRHYFLPLTYREMDANERYNLHPAQPSLSASQLEQVVGPVAYQNWVRADESTHTLAGAIMLLNTVEWDLRKGEPWRYNEALESLLNFEPNKLQTEWELEPRPESWERVRLNNQRTARLRMVAMECLFRGDPTPLLLALPESEKEHLAITDAKGTEIEIKTGWMEGYTTPHTKMPFAWERWDMGECFSLGPAVGDNPTRKSIIDLKTGKVMPEMESVGYIDSFREEDFGQHAYSGDESYEAQLFNAARVFDRFVSEVVRDAQKDQAAGLGQLTIEEFCQTIDRCFPREESRMRVHHERLARARFTGIPVEAARQPDLAALSVLLAEYTSFVDPLPQPGSGDDMDLIREARELSRLAVARRFVDHLGLIDRIRAARTELVCDNPARYWEGVARVACRSCKRRNTYRVTIWYDKSPVITSEAGEPLDRVAQVWRFPGLELGECTRDGVGLVVQDNYIIGRMCYGTGGCGCKLVERVDLGPYTDNHFYYDLERSRLRRHWWF